MRQETFTLNQKELQRVSVIGACIKLSARAWEWGYVTCDLMSGLDANATMLDRLGAPLKVKQERLGHSDSRTTQATYRHVASEDSRKVATQSPSWMSPAASVLAMAHPGCL